MPVIVIHKTDCFANARNDVTVSLRGVGDDEAILCARNDKTGGS